MNKLVDSVECLANQQRFYSYYDFFIEIIIEVIINSIFIIIIIYNNYKQKLE